MKQYISRFLLAFVFCLVLVGSVAVPAAAASTWTWRCEASYAGGHFLLVTFVINRSVYPYKELGRGTTGVDGTCTFTYSGPASDNININAYPRTGGTVSLWKMPIKAGTHHLWASWLDPNTGKRLELDKQESMKPWCRVGSVAYLTPIFCDVIQAGNNTVIVTRHTYTGGYTGWWGPLTFVLCSGSTELARFSQSGSYPLGFSWPGCHFWFHNYRPNPNVKVYDQTWTLRGTASFVY